MISKRQCSLYCVLGVLTAGLSVSASAAPTTGFYVGGGVGQANYDIDYGSQVSSAYQGTDFTVVSANLSRSHDVAGKVYAGYQFPIPLAIELGYVNLGEPTADYALRSKSGLNQNLFTRNANYKIQGINLAAVGTLPLNDQWSLHASVGALFSQLKYSEQGSDASGDAHSFSASNLERTNASFGLGASYRFAGGWGLRADWDRYQHIGRSFDLTVNGNGKFENVDLYSLNLEYRF